MSPINEIEIQGLLELSDLGGHRRLGDPEFLGGPRETQRSTEHMEKIKVVMIQEIHPPIILKTDVKGIFYLFLFQHKKVQTRPKRRSHQ
jgi:hypothetical protein